MGIAIDERWEYWTPDPEIEEVRGKEVYGEEYGDCPLIRGSKRRKTEFFYGGKTLYVIKQDELVRFEELFKGGLSYGKIEKRLGVTKQTLRKWRDWLKLPLRTRRKKV